MIVYNVGDKIKIKEASEVVGAKLEKGMEGIVISLQSGYVEAAFEGLGLVAVSHSLIKKKVRKVEKIIKAKNLKISDEVYIRGTGEYNKIGNIYRNDYENETETPTITVETVFYDSHAYDYNELIEVRR